MVGELNENDLPQPVAKKPGVNRPTAMCKVIRKSTATKAMGSLLQEPDQDARQVPEPAVDRGPLAVVVGKALPHRPSRLADPPAAVQPGLE